MFKLFKKFAKCQDGAVTTDWVLLTAGVVGLAAASTLIINDSIVSVSAEIGEGVQEQQVGVSN